MFVVSLDYYCMRLRGMEYVTMYLWAATQGLKDSRKHWSIHDDSYSVCFSTLLLYATATGGVCDHVSVESTIPGNKRLRGCQKVFDNTCTPRQLVFASLYYNYAAWGMDYVTMYRLSVPSQATPIREGYSKHLIIKTLRQLMFVSLYYNYSRLLEERMIWRCIVCAVTQCCRDASRNFSI